MPPSLVSRPINQSLVSDIEALLERVRSGEVSGVILISNASGTIEVRFAGGVDAAFAALGLRQAGVCLDQRIAEG